MNAVCGENRNDQQEQIRSAPPPSDRWIIVSIDGSTFRVIWRNGKRNMFGHTLSVLTHDLVDSGLKWRPQQRQSHKVRPYTLLKAKWWVIVILDCHRGLWVCVESFFCDRRFLSVLFISTCQGIHIQLLCFMNRLMFLHCQDLCVVAVCASVYFVCSQKKLCASVCVCVCVCVIMRGILWWQYVKGKWVVARLECQIKPLTFICLPERELEPCVAHANEIEWS